MCDTSHMRCAVEQEPRFCSQYTPNDNSSSNAFLGPTLGAVNTVLSGGVDSINVFQAGNVDDTGAVNNYSYLADAAVLCTYFVQ